MVFFYVIIILRKIVVNWGEARFTQVCNVPAWNRGLFEEDDMGVLRKIARVVFPVVLIVVTLLGCRGSVSDAGAREFASFRDIPGVTGEEIAAIEALRIGGEPFVYAMVSSSEAFQHDGFVHGFAALYCRFLTGLFGIEFRPELRDWDEILEGLDTGEIDFTGEMTATSERRASGYFMTDAIANRSIKYTHRVLRFCTGL